MVCKFVGLIYDQVFEKQEKKNEKKIWKLQEVILI